jgi:integrase
MKISEFAYAYYLPHVRLHTSTATSRIQIFSNHIEAHFGNLEFIDLKKIQIYDWRNSLIIRNYKPAMINKIQVIFGQIIDLAEALEVCEDGTRKRLGFETLRITEKPQNFITKNQLQDLLHACDLSSNKDLVNIVKLLVITGARKREILDAQWHNVNIERATLLVPKSKNGSPRIIHLSKTALELITSLPKSSNEFLFINPKTRKPYSCIYYSWHIALKRVGLEGLRIHDLRHSFASALVNRGVNLYDVQHLLGHNSIKSTQRYAHLEDQRLKASLSVVEDFVATS